MVAADTNIVVRFLTGDDPEQYQKAHQLFKQETVFLPDTVLLETAWVLRHAYDFEKNAIVKAFRQLLGLPNIQVNDPQMLSNALDWIEDGLDFADALHLAFSQETNTLYTFDQRFSKRSHDKGDCPVKIL
jgi:predicted nucleic-acid-binding protein